VVNCLSWTWSAVNWSTLKERNCKLHDLETLNRWFFAKLDRLMFADSNINSTILYYFIRKNPFGPDVIRTHDPWIRSQHDNNQRPVITATRILNMLQFNTDLNNILNWVDFWNRDEYYLGVVKITLYFFECNRVQSRRSTKTLTMLCPCLTSSITKNMTKDWTICCVFSYPCKSVRRCAFYRMPN
jgi:hypothetical protein